MALIKQGIDKDSSPERFSTDGATYNYTNARGYPCVKHIATVEDRKARTSLFKRESLKLQMFALYCRHPVLQSLGFAIMFSHRGTDLDPYFEKQGLDFIDGVVVPSHASTPTSDLK